MDGHGQPTSKQAAETQKKKRKRAPPAGGESGGRNTVRPWGGRPVPFYRKAYPVSRRCNVTMASGTRCFELDHMDALPEQMFGQLLGTTVPARPKQRFGA